MLLATVGSALPLALFYIALMQAPAAEVSAWFFLVPVVGVLTAWPLLGETPTAQLLVGMAGCPPASGSCSARRLRGGAGW